MQIHTFQNLHYNDFIFNQCGFFLGPIFYTNWGLAVMWIVLWCHAMLWTGHTHKKESFPESISAESVAAFSNLTSVVYKLWPLKGQGPGPKRCRPGQIKNRCVVIHSFDRLYKWFHGKKQIFFHFFDDFFQKTFWDAQKDHYKGLIVKVRRKKSKRETI